MAACLSPHCRGSRAHVIESQIVTLSQPDPLTGAVIVTRICYRIAECPDCGERREQEVQDRGPRRYLKKYPSS